MDMISIDVTSPDKPVIRVVSSDLRKVKQEYQIEGGTMGSKLHTIEDVINLIDPKRNMSVVFNFSDAFINFMYNVRRHF